MITHGQSITWTQSDGSKTTITKNGYATPEEAMKDCLADALFAGWQPKHWWEYWRRNDTKIPKEVYESLFDYPI